MGILLPKDRCLKAKNRPNLRVCCVLVAALHLGAVTTEGSISVSSCHSLNEVIWVTVVLSSPEPSLNIGEVSSGLLPKRCAAPSQDRSFANHI